MRGFSAGSAASFALVLLTAVAARAGDVNASLKGETLVLKGDDLGAELDLTPPIKLARGANGVSVRVTPQGTTTLNGAAAPATFEPVVDVKITLGDGTNDVLFQNLDLGGKLTFKSGDGADTLTIQDTGFGDDVKVTLGDGPSTLVVFAGSALGDDLSVKSSDGADNLTLSGPVGGSVKLKLGDGANLLQDTGAIGDDFSYKGGPGVDTLQLSGPIGGQAVVKVSHGANSVIFGTGTPVGESIKLTGGSGVDTVDLTNNGVGGDAKINLSSGNNTTTLTDTTIGDDLLVKGKDGDDVVQYSGTVTVTGDEKFKLGGGTNTMPVTAF
jgi:hypothetical protein